MDGMPRVMNCWPGLPQLWLRGSWAGLALAVGFAVLANVVILATFVWTDLLGTRMFVGGWAALILIWGASWVITKQWAKIQASAAEGVAQLSDRLYLEAQEEYLQGNWCEAERALNLLLANDVKDTDARMMLATLKRHTNRFVEAREELDVLSRFEAAAKWEHEIRMEYDAIERLVQEQKVVQEQKNEQGQDPNRDQSPEQELNLEQSHKILSTSEAA